MTITIELRPDEERILQQRAQDSGRELPEYVHQVLEEHIRSGPRPGAAPRTFDLILSPAWEGWRQAGMTEAEVDDLLRQELQEVRRERRERKGTA